MAVSLHHSAVLLGRIRNIVQGYYLLDMSRIYKQAVISRKRSKIHHNSQWTTIHCVPKNMWLHFLQ